MLLLTLLLFFIFILIFVYFITHYNESYWQKRGVIFDKGNVIGPFSEVFGGKRTLFETFGDMYKKYANEPAVGFNLLFTPAIFVIDPNNVRYVMQGHMFIDRGTDYHKEDYLADNLLFMSNSRWKLMRQKMSPTFTTTKLRNMYYVIDKSSQDFIDYLQKNPIKIDNTLDTLSMLCCAAVIGTVFGVTSESLFDSPFLDVAKKAFYPNFKNNFKFLISNVSSGMFSALKLKFFKEHETFFFGAIKQVFRKREREGAKKHDFVDICLNIQKNGVMKDEESGLQLQPTDELLAAQGFFFFIAGVEPTATSLFGAMIEIGRHSEIQKRLHEEIDAVFEKYNNVLTYDAIMEMEYLDKVLNESLRLYPPIGFLTKRCTETTVLPVGNIKIDKGTKVYTPIHAYHHDPRYFKDPHVFNPERFSDEAKKNFGIIYQPFGYGSRICLGMRYARLQAKSGLAHILRNFDLTTCIGKGGIKFVKNQIQVRIDNVEVLYTPRTTKCTFK
ncbi:unnamed protein product [Diatraea saccharalis]|uniref:unspecific monooxygenase n=1 Tax=Diatraea saccharalis TaxID=40085 RepID=A0A9N9QLB7_9NEOP|nr:unnamed protein product [Diatraea saccharalis]